MAGVAAQALSSLHAPSYKERKYDRQLRLWAASGQAALEAANILLVNSGSGTVGVETLKNLVLSGIGRFTIVDEAIVNDGDLGVNFFLDESCRGRSRAQCCADLLLELNPEVSGHWYPKNELGLPYCCTCDPRRPTDTSKLVPDRECQSHLDLQSLLDSQNTFTFIVYTLPMKSDHIDLIAAYSREHRIPMMAVHSVGFYSYFSIHLPGTFPVVETHSEEASNADLRLLNPWPELAAFASDMTREIDSLDNHDHGHLPMIFILLHFLSVWRKSHYDANPTSYKDKLAFRDLIEKGMRRNNPEGAEENFEEAIAAVIKLITSHPLPSSLRQIFNHRDQLECRSSFWVITRAVKQFYEKHNELPLTGALPDMKAHSDVYIKLQSLYKDKARQDALEVSATVRGLAGGQKIDLAEIELFCKNARFIKLVNASDGEKLGLEQVIETELGNDEASVNSEVGLPRSLMPVYMVLSAISDVSTATVQDIIVSIARRAPALAGNERVARVAEEVSRAAGRELHNISAMTGGMVAQEITKVITKQYIPVDNTCVLDCIESRCQVLRVGNGSGI